MLCDTVRSRAAAWIDARWQEAPVAPLLNSVKKVTKEPHKGRPVATLLWCVRAWARARVVGVWGQWGKCLQKGSQWPLNETDSAVSNSLENHNLIFTSGVWSKTPGGSQQQLKLRVCECVHSVFHYSLDSCRLAPWWNWILFGQSWVSRINDATVAVRVAADMLAHYWHSALRTAYICIPLISFLFDLSYIYLWEKFFLSTLEMLKSRSMLGLCVCECLQWILNTSLSVGLTRCDTARTKGHYHT